MSRLEKFFGSSRAGLSIEPPPGSRGSSRTSVLAAGGDEAKALETEPPKNDNPDAKALETEPKKAPSKDKGKGKGKGKGAAKQ